MKVNTYLAHAIVSGLFLSLLIPFIVTADFFFPFITGKNFAFRILTELVFGAWLILALRDVRFRPRFSWLSVAIALFVVVIGIANAFSPNPAKSFWSNFERMEGYVTLLHLFAYFLVASSVLCGEKLWLWMLRMSVTSSVIMGIFGLFQLAGKITLNQGGVRLDGMLGNASYLAAFMLINFFIALFLLVRSRKVPIWKWILIPAMVLQLVILYHTATRGAILGLIGGLFISSIVLLFASKEKKSRLIGASVAGLLVLVSVLAMSLKDSDFVKNQPSLTRLTSISRSEAGPRFMVWNMAWQGFKERPVFGWGQESFNYVFNKYYDPGMYAQEQWFDRTHNVIFDWLVAGGALGLLGYLSILFFALYYIWKQGYEQYSLSKCLKEFFSFRRGEGIPHLPEKALLTGLLAGYVFQNLFVFDNLTSYTLFFMLLAYIHTMSGREIKALNNPEVPEQTTVNRVLVPIVAVMTVFVVYAMNVPAMKASAALIDALRAYPEGVSKNLEKFKEALAYDSFADSEIREQLTSATITAIYSQQVALDLKQKFFDLTKSELDKQIKEAPEDARYRIFYGSFLNRTGNVDEAIVQVEKAIELSPKKQTMLFELGSAYLNKGDLEKAFETMRHAFELDERFSEARVVYAVTAIYASKFDVVQELLEPLSGMSHAYDDRLVQAYNAVGKKEEAIALLEQRVEGNPNDSQARFSLASAYLDSGYRTKAVSVLATISADFPDSREQADYYIQEIRAGRNP